MRESAREDNSLTINIRLHLRHISGLSSKAKSLTVSLDPSISVAKVRELLADAMALPTEELVLIFSVFFSPLLSHCCCRFLTVLLISLETLLWRETASRG